MTAGRDRRFSWLLFTLFAGLYGYTFAVTEQMDMDLSRIYALYDTLRGKGWEEAFPYFFVNGDLSGFFYWSVGTLNFPAQIIGFLSSAFLYGSLALIAAKALALTGKPVRKDLLPIACMLLVFTTHPFFFNGVRSSTGTVLFVLGCLDALQGRKAAGALPAAFAFLVHFYFLPLFFLYLLFAYAGRKTVYAVCCLFLAALLFYRPLMGLLIGLAEAVGGPGNLLAVKIEGYALEWDVSNAQGLTLGSRVWLAQNFILLAAAGLAALSPSLRRLRTIYPYLPRLERLMLLLASFLILNGRNLIVAGRLLYLLTLLAILYLVILAALCPGSSLFHQMRWLTEAILLIAAAAFTLELFRTRHAWEIYANVPRLFYDNLFSLLNLPFRSNAYPVGP